MLRIGDFSRLSQLPTATLRYYDELNLLKPARIDRSNEYRYYHVDQLEKLYRIRALQDLGLSLEEIARVFADADGADALEQMMARSVDALDQQMNELRDRSRRAAQRLAQIRISREWPTKEVVVKSVAPVDVASLRLGGVAMHEIGEICDKSYIRLYSIARKAGWKLATTSPPEITCYHNDSYTETDIQMEVCAVLQAGQTHSPQALDDATRHTLPGHSQVAAIIHRGSFELLEKTVMDLLGWVATHGMEPAGPVRELHLFGRVTGKPDHPADFAVELQVPIRERSVVG